MKIRKMTLERRPDGERFPLPSYLLTMINSLGGSFTHRPRGSQPLLWAPGFRKSHSSQCQSVPFPMRQAVHRVKPICLPGAPIPAFPLPPHLSNPYNPLPPFDSQLCSRSSLRWTDLLKGPQIHFQDLHRPFPSSTLQAQTTVLVCALRGMGRTPEGCCWPRIGLWTKLRHPRGDQSQGLKKSRKKRREFQVTGMASMCTFIHSCKCQGQACREVSTFNCFTYFS